MHAPRVSRGLVILPFALSIGEQTLGGAGEESKGEGLVDVPRNERQS